MNSPDDTIAAIATPVGQGGIGIVRVSGADAVRIARALFRPAGKKGIDASRSHSLLYGHVIDPSGGTVLDEALLSVMRGPRSYTREDVVEINCHGGMIAVRKTLEAVLSLGARLAEPGEFTKRAFLNGRLSLAQAEAVMDVISSLTEESMRVAVQQLKGGLSEKLAELRNSLLEVLAFVEACIDFPEEGIAENTAEEFAARIEVIRGELGRLSDTFQDARFFREGLSVAIAGRPNVGKSSLLNALLKKDKAIVTDIPGTTRDIIEDYLNIDGLPVKIVDTAGIRKTEEAVEKEGVRRSLAAIEEADFVVALLDGSQPAMAGDYEILAGLDGKKALIAVNKTDLPLRFRLEGESRQDRQVLHISAFTGEGLDELKSAIFQSNIKNWNEERQGMVVTNLRHKLALDRAGAALDRAVDLLRRKEPLEFFSIELREALDGIGEITGAVTTEELLDRIFSNFCIGK